MAYESTITPDFTIKNPNDLKTAFKKLEEQELIIIEQIENDDSPGFCIKLVDYDKALAEGKLFLIEIASNMLFYEDGIVECESYFQKWYDSDGLVKFLSPFVDSGGEIIFDAEDGVRWGYRFLRKRVYKINWIKRISCLVK